LGEGRHLKDCEKSAIDEAANKLILSYALRLAAVKVYHPVALRGLLGEAIKRIHSNSSVTSLFEFKGGTHSSPWR
jgi:phosphoribosylpyrophosphate synthetase